MWVLDTDHLTILERVAVRRSRCRCESGWFPSVRLPQPSSTTKNKCEAGCRRLFSGQYSREMIYAYARLQKHVDTFRDIAIFPFDQEAAERFEYLRKARLGIGTAT